MSSNLEVELLKDTKQILENFGWTQRFWYKEGQGYCLLGALRASAITRLGGSEIVLGAKDRIRKIITEDGFDIGIVGWNDDPSRTKEQVLELLDRAINDDSTMAEPT